MFFKNHILEFQYQLSLLKINNYIYIYIYVCVCACVCVLGSSVGIATDYGLDGPGLNTSGEKIFLTHPGQPWDPPSLL